MRVRIHRSDRADRLAQALADVLSEPLDDPFAIEVVCVPTRGVERFLAQSLAAHLGASPGRADGICSAVDFPSPRRFRAAALARALFEDGGPGNDRDDPWRPERLAWPLLTEIDRSRGERWSELLWSYLDGPASDAQHRPNGRRWTAAAHLAELFAAYASSRPAMLAAWQAGRDVDGEGRPLEPSLAWQPELWRRAASSLQVAAPGDQMEAACRRLVADPGLSELPARVSVFGLTRIGPDELAVLKALAAHREVHLWLTHPSPALWDRIGADPALARDRPGPRAQDPTAALPRHRLLGYLGRDARELQVVLSSAGPADDRLYSGPARPATLLGRLQADVAADRPPPALTERLLLGASDASVQVHASHGPDRQVEVLREVLLGLLADDPTLEPRDIIVMCPDIETFAPLIAASFGLDTGTLDAGSSAEHPGHRLRVRLADRSLRRVNPLLSVLDRLLDLADSRLPTSALLDLAATPPVTRRFGFTEDDLGRMTALIRASGVRWGFDAEHRGGYGLAGFGQNTWSAGLDRLLLGVTMDAEGERFLGTALPLDEVDSSDVDLLGRAAELVSRVRAFCAEVTGPAGPVVRSVNWWVETCRDALSALTAVSEADSWQSGHAYSELSRLADRGGAAAEAELSLADLRALLGDAFAGRATRANFRTGTLTMCTMLPMRSVPHRAICLLGVDEGVFPRHGVLDGDDILAREPWVGDRDPRSEDRQLLLDAVMAAQERLIVVYAGRDPRTGAAKPPAVPIGELLDALDETARTADGTPVRERITVQHPLQPFDARNFRAAGDRASDSRCFASFDPAALRGARAADSHRSQPPVIFETTPLPPLPPADPLPLAELIRFFAHPTRALLRARGHLFAEGDDEEVGDQIPIAPDGLQTWEMGQRMLNRHLQGIPLEQLEQAEWRRGQVPPRALGTATLRPVIDAVASIAHTAAPFLVEPRQSMDVLVRLADRTVTGTIGGTYGNNIVSVTYAKLGARHRLQGWLELLALTATDPRAWQSVVVGRGGWSLLGPVGAELATTVLADLVALYDAGLAEALPFAPKTAAEYARIRSDRKSIANLQPVLQRVWDQERDAVYARFFPESLDELFAEPSRAEEVRGQLGEASRFGTLARRVWHVLLQCEELHR